MCHYSKLPRSPSLVEIEKKININETLHHQHCNSGSLELGSLDTGMGKKSESQNSEHHEIRSYDGHHHHRKVTTHENSLQSSMTIYDPLEGGESPNLGLKDRGFLF